MSPTPYASSRLARFIDQRISELHHKTQADIAQETGFRRRPQSDLVATVERSSTTSSFR